MSSVRLPRSRPANWYSDSAVRHRRHGAEDGRRVGAQRDRHRKRLPGVGDARSRGSPARRPGWASQRMITWCLADHLLAVDAQVLALARVGHALRATRVMTRPQVISGPASPGQQCLHRQDAKIDVAALEHHLAAGRSCAPVRVSYPTAPSPSAAGLPASFKPLGGSGSFRLASTRPMSRNSETSCPPPCPSRRVLGRAKQVGQRTEIV